LGGVVERMGQQLGRMALQGHKEAHNHRLEVVAAAVVVQRDLQMLGTITIIIIRQIHLSLYKFVTKILSLEGIFMLN